MTKLRLVARDSGSLLLPISFAIFLLNFLSFFIDRNIFPIFKLGNTFLLSNIESHLKLNRGLFLSHLRIFAHSLPLLVPESVNVRSVTILALGCFHQAIVKNGTIVMFFAYLPFAFFTEIT